MSMMDELSYTHHLPLQEVLGISMMQTHSWGGPKGSAFMCKGDKEFQSRGILEMLQRICSRQRMFQFKIGRGTCGIRTESDMG